MSGHESDWARLLLGDSFHPGGVALTPHLGAALGLHPGLRVLDIASGTGASALALARAYGCAVVGVDLGAANVRDATAAAARAGLGGRVRFARGDAERLPFDDASFDAVLCECAFCTFPDKRAAASEFARVLRPGGRVGLSDLTRVGAVPPELAGLLAWVACIADARPLDEYVGYLNGAGLSVGIVEPHDAALSQLVGSIRTKLLGAEMLVKLKKLTLPGAIDFAAAKGMVRAAAAAVADGTLGYALVVAAKGIPEPVDGGPARP